MSLLNRISLIKTGLVVFLWVVALYANGAIDRKSPAAFQAAQIEYQYNELVELTRKSNVDVLSEYGIDIVLVEEFVSTWRDYLSGQFFVEDFECGDLDIDGLSVDGDGGDAEDRLDLIQEQGIEIFWGAAELSALKRAVVSGDVGLEGSEGPHIAAACKRIQKLASALSCVVDDPDSCPDALKEEILNEAITIDGHPNPIRILDKWNASLKTAFHRYLPRLQATLTEQGELYDALMSFAKNDAVSHAEVVSLVVDQIKEAIIADVYVSLFEIYAAMPSETRSLLLVVDSLSGLERQAKSALDTIKAARAVYEEGKIVIPKAISHSARVEAEAAIKRFVDEFASSFIDTSFLDELEAQVDETIVDPLKQSGQELCDALASTQQEIDWGSLMWGRKPTEDNPLGFRVVFKPTGQKERYAGQLRESYTANVELLALMPAGAEYTHNPVIDVAGNSVTCKNLASSTYIAVDLGVTISDVYRDEQSRYEFANGFRIAAVAGNNVISTIEIKSALEKLGIPGAWMTDVPDWVVSNDFQNISMTLPLMGDSVDIPIVANGQFVFDLGTLGASLCNKVEEAIAPILVKGWSDRVEIPIGDSSLTLAGTASQSISIPHCEAYTAGSNSVLKPLIESRMAADVKLVVKGEIESGKPFSWPVSTGVNVYPDRVSLKSAIFGDVPPEINAYLEAKLKSFVNGLFGVDLSGWQYSIKLGAPAIKVDWSKLTVPMSFEVFSDTCAATNLALDFDFATGDIKSRDGRDVAGAVVELVSCGLERQVAEVVRDSLPSCDAITEGLFGMADLDTTLISDTGDRCELSIKGQLASKDVVFSPVIANLGAGNKWGFDFSKVQVQGELVEALKGQFASLMEGFGTERFELNVSTGKNALLVDLVLLPSGPNDLLGRVELGTFTLSADGRHSFKSELDRIVANKIAAVLEPKLEEIVRRLAPEEVVDIDFEITYTNTLMALGTFKVKLNEQILIPASITLLPKLDAEIALNEEFLRTQAAGLLASYLNPLIPLKGGPVEVTPPVYDISPSYDVTLTTGIAIKLDELGSITLKDINITGRGVDFKGRAEMRLNDAIILSPSPVPIYFTRPGIFYDFERKRVGALGALTIIAPPVDKLLHIDGEIYTSDASRFIEELGILGELVLMDTIPVVIVEGGINFADLSVVFNGRTSELFGKILSAQVNGELRGKEGTAAMQSHLVLLGVKLAETMLVADIAKCPKRCIKAEAYIDFLLGDGTIGAEFGPFLVDAKANLSVGLDIFGKKYGQASLNASILQARLKAKVLFLSLNVSTPKLNDMTPSYIAEIIASLLNVKIEDVLEWLKKPKIEFAPAGKPASESGGSTDGKGDDGGTPSSGGNQGTGASAGANQKPSDAGALPGGSSDEDPKKLLSKSALPDGIVASRQRDASNDGKAIRACHEKQQRWGNVYYSTWSKRWFFWGWRLPKNVFDIVCSERIGSGPWEAQTGAFTIKDEFARLETLSRYTRYRDDSKKCTPLANGDVKCVSAAAQYNVWQTTPEPAKEPSRWRLWGQPFEYLYIQSPKSDSYDAEITLSKRERKRLEPWFDLLKKKNQGAKLTTRERRKLNLLVTRVTYYLEEEGLRADAIIDINEADGVVSGIGNFFSGNTTYKVDYSVAQSATTQPGHDYVSILVNEKVTEAVFLYECWPRDSKICSDVPFQQANDLALGMVKNVNIQPDKMPIIQDPIATAWVLNDAIPSVLRGEKPPARGSLIQPDTAVAQCGLESIQLFDDPEKLSFRFERSTDGIQRISNLNIDKAGPHADWANSDDDVVITAMASFLACQDNANAWLDQHRMWLTPEENSVDGALLFMNRGDQASELQTVKRIEAQVGHADFKVQRLNPYLNKTSFELEDLIQLYRSIRQYGSDEAVVLVNTEEQFEVSVFRKLAGGEKNTVLLRPLSNTNRPFTKPVVFEGLGIPKSNFKACFDKLPGFNGDIRDYFKLDRPTLETGVSPRLLLDAIQNFDSVNCSL